VLSCVSAQNIVIHDIMSLSNLTVPWPLKSYSTPSA
jgi:hypothetical protein